MLCPRGHNVSISYGKWRQHQDCEICNNAQLPKKLVHNPSPRTVDSFRVLALDDATGTTGFSIYENGVLINYGHIIRTQRTAIQRISAVRRWLMYMIEVWQPDLVGIQDIQLQYNKIRNVQSFKVLAQLQGALLITLHDLGIGYEVVPSVRWRSHCRFQSKTSSDQKREAQRKVENWFRIKATQDEADAICIGKFLADTATQDIVGWEDQEDYD